MREYVFTCPICRRVSQYARDLEERFCGICGFVDDIPKVVSPAKWRGVCAYPECGGECMECQP